MSIPIVDVVFCIDRLCRCITYVLNHHDALSARSEEGWPPSSFVTHLVYLKNTSVGVDEAVITVSFFLPRWITHSAHMHALQGMGIQCVEVEPLQGDLYDAPCVAYAMDAIMSNIRGN